MNSHPLSRIVTFRKEADIRIISYFATGKNINNMAKIKQAYKKEKTAASRT